MTFLERPALPSRRVGLFPGSFNPLTRAHLAVADAARECVDAVVFVMPRAFPHKQYEGPSLEQRMALVSSAIASHPALYAAVSDGGLFIEMAREARVALGDVAVHLICGRDAAERIVEWPYGAGHEIERQLREYGLLVAARQGQYAPPEKLAHAIAALPMKEGFDEDSATEVRRRLQSGEPWRYMVPPSIQDEVERLYAAAAR